MGKTRSNFHLERNNKEKKIKIEKKVKAYNLKSRRKKVSKRAIYITSIYIYMYFQVKILT